MIALELQLALLRAAVTFSVLSLETAVLMLIIHAMVIRLLLYAYSHYNVKSQVYDT